MTDPHRHFLPAELVVNIALMDDQHAYLFARLEALKSLCIAQNALPKPEAEALYQTLVEHCDSEAALAKAAGLDFQQHDLKHRAMLAGIRKMINEVLHERLDVFSLIRYVDYWFERHILDEDKHLGAALEGKHRHDDF